MSTNEKNENMVVRNLGPVVSVGGVQAAAPATSAFSIAGLDDATVQVPAVATRWRRTTRKLAGTLLPSDSVIMQHKLFCIEESTIKSPTKLQHT